MVGDRNDYSTSDHGITIEVPVYNKGDIKVPGLREVNINDEKMENLKKLETIASLPDDWNANGAGTFSGGLIKKMRDLLLLLEVQPEIFPTACGSLQMEYDKMDGSHMEIELTEDEAAEVFTVDGTGAETMRRIPVYAEEINGVVRDFYG